MEWYYLKNGQQLGPVPEGSLRAWLETGFLRPDDLVWRSGMSDWLPVSDVPEFSGSPRAGAARPTFGTPTLPPPAGYAAHAGFWFRAAAYLLDSLLLSVVLVIAWLLGPLRNIEPTDLQQDIRVLAAAFLLSWIYYASFEGSRFQATPGKRAFRLRVTDLEGKPIGFVRASLRHVGKILSGLIFYIGYAMAGVTPRRQALHDMIAKCLVVRE